MAVETQEDLAKEYAKQKGESQAELAQAYARQQTAKAPQAAPVPSAPPVMHYRVPGATASMGVWHPSAMERITAPINIAEQAAQGLRGVVTPKSNLGALAKPFEGAADPRALAPERVMTPAERERHPIATGIGEFAGGMTTPGSMLIQAGGGLGKILPGVAGFIVPRLASAGFSGQQIYDAYKQVPEFKAAMDRGDASEAQRIFTHITLGVAMAAMGVQHAATGEGAPTKGAPTTMEAARKSGQVLSRLKGQSVTLDHMSETGTGLYNSVRQDLIKHQEALEADGAKLIQAAIDADKGDLTNTRRIGAIPTAPAVLEATKLAKQIGAPLKPGEQGLFERLGEQPVLSLEEAKLLRTAIGRGAFGRGGTTESRAVFRRAWGELGEGMKARVKDLTADGTSGPFDDYNRQFTAAFELNKGIAGEMMESLQGQDRSAAMPSLKKFSRANLTEIREQMGKLGLTQEAARLAVSKKQAANLSGSYDVASGQYAQGIHQLARQNLGVAIPALATWLGLHSIPGVGFMIPAIGGGIVGGEVLRRVSGAKARAIGEQLHSTLPSEYFRTRTEARDPRDYTYKELPAEPPPAAKPAAPKQPYVPGELTRQIAAAEARQAAKMRAQKPRVSAEEVTKRQAAKSAAKPTEQELSRQRREAAAREREQKEYEDWLQRVRQQGGQ